MISKKIRSSFYISFPPKLLPHTLLFEPLTLLTILQEVKQFSSTSLYSLSFSCRWCLFSWIRFIMSNIIIISIFFIIQLEINSGGILSLTRGLCRWVIFPLWVLSDCRRWSTTIVSKKRWVEGMGYPPSPLPVLIYFFLLIFSLWLYPKR